VCFRPRFKRVFFIQNQCRELFGSSLNRIFNKKLALILSKPVMLYNYQKFDTKLVAQSLRGFLSFSHLSVWLTHLTRLDTLLVSTFNQELTYNTSISIKHYWFFILSSLAISIFKNSFKVCFSFFFLLGS